MYLKTEKERNAHPQACLIPFGIWEKFFGGALSEEICLLMQERNEETLIINTRLFSQKKPTSIEKQQAWLAVALSYQNIHTNLLHSLAHLLGISHSACIELTIILGNKNYLLFLVEKTFAPNMRHFQLALRHGHHEIVDYLLECVLQEKHQDLIAAINYDVFLEVTKEGRVEALLYLLAIVPQEKAQSLIAAEIYYTFREAARKSRVEALIRLLTRVPKEKIQALIDAEIYYTFRQSARKGRTKELSYLLRIVPQEKAQALMAADNYGAYRDATGNGHTEIVNYLVKQVASHNKRAMFAAVYQETTKKVHFEEWSDVLTYVPQERIQNPLSGALIRLLTRVSKEMAEVLAAEIYDFFREAASANHIEIMHFLLDFPSVFSHVESHWEYGCHVLLYLNTRLRDLHARKDAFEQEYPFDVFDVSESEVKTLFYYARHLIRCNTSEHQESLLFLFGIPALRNQAHCSMDRGSSNELIRLAQSLGNGMAYELLLSIPACTKKGVCSKGL